jgi:hypothetical protein
MGRVIFGIVTICAAMLAQAQDETLTVGQARLAIGMDRATAWEGLKRHDVQCIGDRDKQHAPKCDSWFVSIKEKHGERYTPIGSVYFADNGRVKLIMKYYDERAWGSSPAKFANFLYEVLLQYTKDGGTLSSSVSENREPGWIAKSIFFSRGRKTVTVGYGEGGRDADGKPIRPFVSLHEELR